MTKNDYLRQIANDLKEVGVDKITPDDLFDLACYLDADLVERALERATEGEE